MAKFLNSAYFKAQPRFEQEFILRLWAMSGGFPFPAKKEYIESLCFNRPIKLSKNWFYKTLYNLQVSGIIETYKDCHQEHMLYFKEKEEELKAANLGPFASNAEINRGGQWRLKHYGVEKFIDTKEGTKGETILPEKYSRNQRSRGNK